ncbi:MAG: M23 family metallopeptidase [Pseudomonadota bacterium]
MAKTLTVARGDTLADILLRAGVSARDAYEAVEALRPLFSPRKLRQGQSLSVTLTSQEGQETATSQPLLAQVALKTEFGQRVEVARQPQGGFAAQAVAMAVETRPVLREGPIADSLYLAGTRAGVPAAILIEMIQIFSYSVDFQREIRAGDVFRVLYEERTAEDGETALGPIAYGELILSGKSRALYRFTPSDDGRTDYFSPDGKSARRLLMKTPIDGARLTSRYGARKHPVLGYVRNHPGIDFGAPTGTPIYAAGDGVVEKAARWGSYGNYIRIRHANGYKTAYAHLSKYGKGVRAGARVTQGQVIGYVGATGRVTGPHLHYEVYANDSRINPLTLKLPTGRVLSGGVLASFRQAKAELDIATGLSLVAQDMVEGQTSGANPARGTD